MMTNPHDILRDRVSGAIARGEAAAITEQSTPEAREAYRKSVFAAFPPVLGFLSGMLIDAQLSEDEEAFSDGRAARDTGTVYTCPDSTFRVACNEVATFLEALDKISANVIHGLGGVLENVGHDLYMRRAGHGVGFDDRDIWSPDSEENAAIAKLMTLAVTFYPTVEAYIGDDGQLYVCGKEEA